MKYKDSDVICEKLSDASLGISCTSRILIYTFVRIFTEI